MKLKCNEPLSNTAVNYNMRRYTTEEEMAAAGYRVTKEGGVAFGPEAPEKKKKGKRGR